MHEWEHIGNVSESAHPLQSMLIVFQSLWLQDFPLAEKATANSSASDEAADDPVRTPHPEEESFQEGLVRVLNALTVPAALKVHWEAYNNGEGIAPPIQRLGAWLK